MKKIAISFCSVIFSYLTLIGPAHAEWVQTNCRWVKITVNSESDGWRMECDLEYLPDPSSGLDSGGGNGMGTKPFVFEDLIKQGGNLFCKHSVEPCAQPGWLSRMLVQCATYGSGVQGSCNSAVYTESLANDCRNTKPC
jgi:hypothetical protein